MAVQRSSSSSVSRSSRPAATTAKRSTQSSSKRSSSGASASRGTSRTSNPSKARSTQRNESTTAASAKARTSEVKSGSQVDSFKASAELREEQAAGKTRASEEAGTSALLAGLNANYGAQAVGSPQSNGSVSSVSAPGSGQDSALASRPVTSAGAQDPRAQDAGNQNGAVGTGAQNLTGTNGNGTQTTAGTTGTPGDGTQNAAGATGTQSGQAPGETRREEAVRIQGQVEDGVKKGQEAGTPPSETVKQLQQQLGDPPKLDNVLTVHGLFADESSFKTMTDYWTSTGANQMGGTIKGAELSKLSMDEIKAIKDPAELAKRLGLNHQGNIFNMQFSGNAANSDVNKAELAKAVQVVSQLRGGGMVDLVSHSKGGVDSRNLLDSGQGDKVRSLTMLGTPNKGSGVADLAQTLPGQLATDNLFATERTNKDRAALPELGKGSNFLQRLNQRFQDQLSRLPGGALAIQGSTPLGGDGVVSHDSATVPGAINKTAWGSTHIETPGYNLGITASPSVIGEVSKFLSGQQLTPGRDLYDSIGGRALHTASDTLDAGLNLAGQAYDGAAYYAQQGWDGAKSLGTQAVQGVSNAAQSGWEGAKYYGNQAYEGATHYGQQGWEGAKHYGNQAYEGAAYYGNQAYDAVTTTASDTWNRLTGLFR